MSNRLSGVPTTAFPVQVRTWLPQSTMGGERYALPFH
jgi:hypothetical protein